MKSKFKNFLSKRKKRVDGLLFRYLTEVGSGAPRRLSSAIKYVVLNGGKRIRSLLVFAVGEAYGANIKFLDAPALALEMIHSFSLVHDDLPAMDDDGMRRGKPTCHLAYDEATAILVGDTLSVLAFQVINEDKHLSSENKADVSRILAEASGPKGIAGGQYLDLHMPKKPTKRGLEAMYLLKTGSLISAAVKMGAIVSGASKKDLKKLEKFAYNIGFAFQIKDDILNIEGDAKKMGKNIGTDEAQEKITYPMLVGMKKAKTKMQDLCDEAYVILDDLGFEDSFLGSLTDFIIRRDF